MGEIGVGDKGKVAKNGWWGGGIEGEIVMSVCV